MDDDDHHSMDERREAELEKWAREFEPTKKEVDAWAEAERKRRSAWASGPSEKETRDWVQRTKWERAYRSAVSSPSAGGDMPQYGNWFREATLASEGVMAWLWTSPAKLWESMVKGGYSWERRWNSPAERYRRMRYPED
jgi:hypothetical protein